MEKALSKVDPNTQEITDPSVIPVCKNCKGPFMLNVRSGNWFMENLYKPQEEKFNRWLEHKLKPENCRKLVILEIGAGFNTPIVLRYPNEDLASSAPNAEHHEVPEEILGTTAVGIRVDALKALQFFKNKIVH
jgi:hypothetical protein